MPNCQMEGSVEEVDTGKQLHFQTEDELVGFLRKRFIQACRSLPDSEEFLKRRPSQLSVGQGQRVIIAPDRLAGGEAGAEERAAYPILKIGIAEEEDHQTCQAEHREPLTAPLAIVT